jgi:hypothetical protein
MISLRENVNPEKDVSNNPPKSPFRKGGLEGIVLD